MFLSVCILDRVQALEILEELMIPGSDVVDVRDPKAVADRLKCPLAAKQYGNEDVLAPLIAKACISVCPGNPVNFNVDNVRTVKVPGASQLNITTCTNPQHNCSMPNFWST